MKKGNGIRRRAVRNDVVNILERSMAMTSMMFASPIIVSVACAIRLTMGSPIFFKQKRPGLDGRPFKLVKFRTMKEVKQGEAEPKSDQERLTSLGKILRATSLDELPTLINVYKGDMSFVGPRPLLMKYLEKYNSEQARRHEVKPGITGWAQVNGRNAISWEEKFKLDVWYVDNKSLALDLKILAMTVLKVLKREGISADGEATMPEFMGSEKG